MCGIFGIVIGESCTLSPKVIESAAARLFKLSESRGKESAGLAVRNGGPIQVLKQPIPASVMIRSTAYRTLLREVTKSIGNGSAGQSGVLIGHSRLVTNGAQENNANNQPVIAEGLVAIHNGIITNDAALWQEFPMLQREFEVDTEILLRLIRLHHRQGMTPTEAVRAAYGRIEGCASVAIIFNDLNHLLLATNNGSLYRALAPRAGLGVFASEEYILRQLFSHCDLPEELNDASITRVEPGEACWIHLEDLKADEFELFEEGTIRPPMLNSSRSACEIVDLSDRYESEFAGHRTLAYTPVIHATTDRTSLLFEHLPYVKSLKRCTKCVLPETYPLIQFDAAGVCNQCRDHRPIMPKGVDELARLADLHRGDGKRPDCLMAVSGGRDSTYGLHYAKNVLKLNPIAYTYDWGMVTDLARRNISRICGKLGVEHILVSANIARKRENIRKNIVAWLKRPNLGVIPLFMAGDKAFFYHAKKVQQQVGVDLVIWCSGSGLEGADFKWQFCGVQRGDRHNLKHVDASASKTAFKLRLMAYYAKQFFVNPSYLNSSIWDTMFGYYAYYVMPRNFLYLFNYLPWDEKEILDVLVNQYDWEASADTKQTWRIGDGTASFYNYIYHTVAGFSENDTFRSEQVRRGMITRAEALEFVEQENVPRYESIKWYLGIIGLGDEFNRVISTINSIPKMYPAEN